MRIARFPTPFARPGTPLALAFVVAAGMLPGPTHAAAQGLGSATIVGEVVDEAGEPVAFARVEAHYLPTGVVSSVSSGPEGQFQIRNLRPGGPYRLTVRAFGFGDYVQEGIVLRADQRLELTITPSEEPIRLEALEVTPGNPRFDVSRMAPALSLRREAIEGFPTIERSFLEMAALSPMAVQTREESGYSISGQPERHNAMLVDGALSQDVFGTSTSGISGARARAKPIPMDAIQEFRVEVAPFDVRSSGFTGGVLNAITRSGTNEWHGSALFQYRDEHFFGDLIVDSESMAPRDYQRRLGAFTLGGPLARDRAHIFVAAEYENRREPAPGFTSGEHDPLRIRITPDSLARMSQILSDGYGVAPGTPGAVSLDNPLTNTFLRLDVRLNDRHELVVRHNFAHAARDSTPNRASFGPYEYSSAGYRVESTTHALIGTLTSRVGEGHSNEFMVNVHDSREGSRPATAFPQVDVRLSSEMGDHVFTRHARAGSRYFAQRDDLEQTVFQLNNAFTLSRPGREIILGGSLDFYRFRHELVPGAAGYYRFDSLDDLAANRPSHYEIRRVTGASEPAVTFSVAQPSLFAQNTHTFSGGFSLDWGLRLDVPIFLTRPEYAETVSEEFGLLRPRTQDRESFQTLQMGTEGPPSPTFLVSPRMGFNYQSSVQSRYRTQVRGGWGVFTGRMPFSWLSDVYRNNGLHTALLWCEDDAAPAFDPANPAPLACTDGRDLEGDGEHRVFGFRPQFRYPRELKVSVSVDQELPGGMIASLEGIFVQTFGRPMLKELNLGLPDITDDEGNYERAFGDRVRFGDAVPSGYRPVRRVDGFSQVLSMENDTRNGAAYTLTFDMEKEFGDWLQLQGSYSWARSNDRQSLVYPDQAMSFGSSPVGFHVNQPHLARSAMDRPWKTVGHALFRLPRRWGGTELSLVYTGQAGIPYSYVYGSDINGDGYAGRGIPLDASNDLLFVPDPPGSIPSPSPVTRSLFARLVAMEPCLQAAVGEIMRRNTCRAPDTHRMNLHIAQPLEIRGVRLEATADILNVLNLLNREWGLVWEVDPVVPAIDFLQRADPEPGETVGRPLLGYGGGVARNPVTGQLEPRLPHYLMLPASQWQAQVGLRLSF